MLVLTRKEQEKILVGDEIEIVVLSVEGGRVRIGLQAPRNIRIMRAEMVARWMERELELA